MGKTNVSMDKWEIKPYTNDRDYFETTLHGCSALGVTFSGNQALFACLGGATIQVEKTGTALMNKVKAAIDAKVTAGSAIVDIHYVYAKTTAGQEQHVAGGTLVRNALQTYCTGTVKLKQTPYTNNRQNGYIVHFYPSDIKKSEGPVSITQGV